jgi:hypothetical protein
MSCDQGCWAAKERCCGARTEKVEPLRQPRGLGVQRRKQRGHGSLEAAVCGCRGASCGGGDGRGGCSERRRRSAGRRARRAVRLQQLLRQRQERRCQRGGGGAQLRTGRSAEQRRFVAQSRRRQAAVAQPLQRVKRAVKLALAVHVHL